MRNPWLVVSVVAVGVGCYHPVQQTQCNNTQQCPHGEICSNGVCGPPSGTGGGSTVGGGGGSTVGGGGGSTVGGGGGSTVGGGGGSTVGGGGGSTVGGGGGSTVGGGGGSTVGGGGGSTGGSGGGSTGGSGGGFTMPDGGEATVLNSTLPSVANQPGVFWDGHFVYVLGGSNAQFQSLDSISKFDPAAQTLTPLPEKLPGPNASFCLAWTGSAAFMFGGVGGGSTVGQWQTAIVKYEPATGAVTTMNAMFPNGRYNCGAAWSGQYIYVFGGYNTSGVLNEVYRYDPVADQLTLLNASLPVALQVPKVFFDGTLIDILGGSSAGGAGTPTATVFQFDPATETTIVPGETLPYHVYDSPAVFDGTSIYLLGGLKPDGTAYTSVIQYTPALHQSGVLPGVTLPFPLVAGGAAWTTDAGYIFGGNNWQSVGNYPPVDTIIEFVP